MANYLGIQPTINNKYYFISYNSEDTDRVIPFVQELDRTGIPLWYDYGLEYSDKWESNIADKIENCEALILFFTKGILGKSNSYVKKEYKMATQFFNKPIYVFLMDKVSKEDILNENLSWWIEIEEHQSVDARNVDSPEKVRTIIKESIKILKLDKFQISKVTLESDSLSFQVMPGINGIGRDGYKNNIVFPRSYDSVSRIHAMIGWINNEVRLFDYGPACGTFVNDKRLNPHEEIALKDNDKITFGIYDFVIRIVGER